MEIFLNFIKAAKDIRNITDFTFCEMQKYTIMILDYLHNSLKNKIN